MGYFPYEGNVYYEPEKHGLILLGSVDLSEPDYSFDMLAVWKDTEGFYLGTDSGCSCPSPFENYDGKSDLTGPLTADQAVGEARSLKAGSYTPEYEQEEFEALMKKIWETE